MNGLTQSEETQLLQTIEMFEVITQSQPDDYQSLEILKEAYSKLGRAKEAVGTAKRIAEAYMRLGQLSSAILEYETILQQFPDDPDVKRALTEIEKKADTMNEVPLQEAPESKPPQRQETGERGPAPVVEDGREAMRKLFVDGKHITGGDFDLCWRTPNAGESPREVVDPFLQVLRDKNLLPFEKSLKVLCDKSGLGYIPLDRYDLDQDLVKKPPTPDSAMRLRDTCRRWCVLPFDRMSKSIMVATCNPYNKQAAEELLRVFDKQRLLWYVTQPEDLIKLIKKVLR
jgi:tetratricopeptide (TPR) repeat protein